MLLVVRQLKLRSRVPPNPFVLGMRNSSQVHVYIDIAKAMQAGIKFYLSENGVVLTPGNDEGYLNPMFFQRVESPNHKPIPGLLDESVAPALTDKEVPEATPPAADRDITQDSPSLTDPMPTELSEESDKPVS